MLTQLQAVSALSANNAVGILSTDFADSVRGSLRILAFQDTGQLAGYYPDSSVTTRDKRNVRDGHYAIWGPLHLFTRLGANGYPASAPAGEIIGFIPRRAYEMAPEFFHHAENFSESRILEARIGELLR